MTTPTSTLDMGPGAVVAPPEPQPGNAAPPAGGTAPGAPSPPPPSRSRLRPRLRRKPLLLVGAAAVAAAVALSFRPVPLEVQTAAVVRGPLEATVDADGVTRVVDRFQVAAPVAGRLDRIRLREGDPIPAGAEVARIAPVPLDARTGQQARARVALAQALLREAEARVEQTEAARLQAERTVARVHEVAAVGGFSVEAVERYELETVTAQREHDAALSRARAAAAEVRVAQSALLDGPGGGATVVLRTPVAGQVLRVHEPSERVVAAGTPLIEVGDAARLEVVTDVLSTEAVRIAAGSPARVVDWGGEGVLDGVVRRVEAAGFTKVSALGVEEQRVNVVVDLTGPPPALGDRYRVGVRVVTWASDDVLRVPLGALFRAGGEWAVFVVEDGRARQRPVRIGNRGVAEAEILGGLGAGESVILFPSDQLRDGVRVAGR
jgi:HlyD family secretion protein